MFENVKAGQFVIAFMSEVEQGLAGSSLNLGLLAQISNGYHIGQSNSPCDTIT